MNGMNFKPFIHKLLDSLSDEQIKAFNTLINSHSDDFKRRSLVAGNLTNADKGIGLYTIQLDDKTYKTGYLVFNDTYCVLLAYVSNDERITEFLIKNNTYSVVKEHLTTDYLRHAVEIKAVSVGELIEVQADDINSEDAADGSFLVADGESGSQWRAPAEGSAVKLLGYNTEGELVEDDIPEGIVVDSELNGESDNAVANSAVVAGLNEKLDINDIDDELSSESENPVQNKVINAALEEKANVDGNYPTMTVGLADNLTPYGEDSGASQDNPFISNGTGTNNNTEIVTVGDYGLFKEKQGNTLVANQLVVNGNFPNNVDNWTLYNCTASVSSGVCSLSISANTNFGFYQTIPNKISGHKMLLICNALSNQNITIDFNWGINVLRLNLTTSKQYITEVFDTPSVGNSNINFSGIPTFNATIQLSNICLIDLTQMFNGNIPQDLLDNPSHFSWYYNGSLAYNTGSLVNANGVKLVSTGRNIYNTNETYNVVIPNKPFFASKTTTITYYDKDKNSVGTESVSAGNTFTTPSNCVFISSSVSAITITPYYTDQEGGEGYKDNSNTPIEYPYETPYIADTGTEILRSVGSVKGTKAPSGLITEKVDVETLDSNKAIGDTITISEIKSDTTNVVSKYGLLSEWGTISGTTITLTKALSTNDVIYYEKASATTTQGTPFAENLPINDYGMLYWLDSSDNLVGIPQGAKIFYPTNYKGFVDDMYSRVDGDSSAYVVQDELVGYVKQGDLSSEITDNNSLSWDIKKAYKIGNIVSLTIRAQSPSAISSNLTIFNLGTSLRPSAVIYGYARVSGQASQIFIDTDGRVFSTDTLSANGYIVFTITYAVA